MGREEEKKSKIHSCEKKENVKPDYEVPVLY